MDFFTSQDRARRNTGMLVFLYVLAVLAIILGVYLAIRMIVFWQEAQTTTGESTPLFDPKLMLYIGVGTLLVVGGATFVKIMELSSGGAGIAKSLGGRRIEPGSADPLDRRVLNVVEEMAIAAGMAVPDVYMMDSESGINAFAAGNSVDEAVIGVTRGCVERLSRDELQGVVAHEFSHILHGDMKLNLRLIGVLHGILVIGLIGSLLLRNAAFAGGSRSRRDGRGVMVMLALGVALFVIGMLGTLFGRLIQAAVSRQREFLADASAVRFTRDPTGMAGALKRIGARKDGSRIRAGKVEEYRHMYFGAGTSEMVSALATHPPLEERIRRIEPRWNGQFPEPEAPPLPDKPTKIKTPPATGRSQTDVLKQILTAGVLTGAVQNVGRPSHDNLVQAQELLGNVPQRLRTAVQTLAGARAVVCATLIDSDASSRQKQLIYLEGRGEPLRDDVVNYLSLMRPIGPRVRLPLVGLAMPALRHMNEGEYQALMADVDYLSRTDAVIDPFEWVLGRVLRHHLAPKFDAERKPRKRTARIADSREAVALLLTQIARAGHNDPAMQQAAFDAGAAILDGEWQMVAPAQTTLPALDAAVDVLMLMLATEKKTVLEACAAAIAADREVTVTEGELLRGISDVLECPMPLI